MERRGRLEEEFESGDEEQAFDDYAHISEVLSANYSLMADELSKLMDFQKGAALDIGTGLGDLAIEIGRRFPEIKVIGIDISKKAIEEAVKKAKNENLSNVTFQIQDVHKFRFEDNSIDLIASHGTLHHFKDILAAFREIYRILKPGGVIYLTDLRRDASEETIKEVKKNLPPSQARAFINSVRASYTPQELKEILNKSGVKNFNVSAQKFSRDTIVKNKDKLRQSSMRSVDYTRLSQVVIIKKQKE